MNVLTDSSTEGLGPPPEPSRLVRVFFIRDSIFGREVEAEIQRLGQLLDGRGGWRFELIDVRRQPDLADEYKIDALPTILVGNQRYIGKPKAESLAEVLLPLE